MSMAYAIVLPLRLAKEVHGHSKINEKVQLLRNGLEACVQRRPMTATRYRV